MPVILSCSLSLYRADVFFCHANQTSRQKATPRQTPSRQTRPEECCPEEACPRQSQGPPPLKETPQASLVQKKPAPSDPRDNVYLNGALRLETRAAIRASRAFLKMALRHLRAPHFPLRG